MEIIEHPLNYSKLILKLFILSYIFHANIIILFFKINPNVIIIFKFQITSFHFIFNYLKLYFFINYLYFL